jgi:hypothetical protein
MRIQAQSVIIGTLADLQKDCAAVSYSTCEPFAVIWIGVVKLHDVYKFIQPSKNNQWCHHVSPETEIIVTIHATGSRIDCQVHASRLVVQHKPVCNVSGHEHNKRVACSNGMIYSNQSEAAECTGVTQGAVSAVINGRLKAVKGLIFSYVA